MKYLISLLFCAGIAFGQEVSKPLIIHGDGNQVPIQLVNSQQALPWIYVGNTTNTLYRVNKDGSIYTAATTNQITFGGTNAAPTTTTNAAAWISVTVAGNTNVYLLPVYK
jgi:hypothetical protein